MYDGYKFKNPVAPFNDPAFGKIPPEVELGDNWCRFFVRMMEVAQSIEIVRQALDRYPSSKGEYRLPFKMNQKLPTDEVYLETECPKGSMGFYVVGDGDAEPFRARAKSSCFCNLSVTGASLPRRADRRHPFHCRLARHRDGRDRQMIRLAGA